MEIVKSFITLVVDSMHLGYQKSTNEKQKNCCPLYVEGWLMKVDMVKVKLNDNGPVEIVPDFTYLTDKVKFYISSDILPKNTSIASITMDQVQDWYQKIYGALPFMLIPPPPLDTRNVPPAKRDTYQEEVKKEIISKHWQEFLK